MSSPHWGGDLAADLHALAARLVEAEHQRASLPVLLGYATRLAREATCYFAAAVQDARSAGSTWEDIGSAAGVSVETARAQWNEARVKRLLARRAREPIQPPGSDRQRPAMGEQPSAPRSGVLDPSAVLPSQKLAAALSHLQRQCGLAIGDAARQADLSPSYLSKILAGERVPAWPVVHMLATIFRGNAQELRVLWEGARGLCQPSRQSMEVAAQRLQAALRGLHLAAACPDPEVLCRGTALAPAVVRGVLSGEHIPDWPTTAQIVARLAAHPALIKPLWEDVHYAFLASHSAFPTGGMATGGSLPDADSSAS